MAARAKERHPEAYCPEPRCLWRTGGGRCPRHPGPFVVTPKPIAPETIAVHCSGCAATIYDCPARVATGAAHVYCDRCAADHDVPDYGESGPDYGGAFDGNRVISDADTGL